MSDLADTFYPAHQIGEWAESDLGQLYDLLTGAHQPWRQQAACRGMDTNLFFPARGAGQGDARQARQVCAGCPVKTECLDAGLEERQGIFGGLTERERRGVRRTRRGEAA